MGFIEETGAAQHYRDARIAPIYEGTNGIQAVDLVIRKIRGDCGTAFRALLVEIEAATLDCPALSALAHAVRETGEWMLTDGDINARLASAYPFMTMMSILVSGWLFRRQRTVIDQADENRSLSASFVVDKVGAYKYFTTCIVTEAVGLRESALCGQILCELDAHDCN